jgi:hypothetical protein
VHKRALAALQENIPRAAEQRQRLLASDVMRADTVLLKVPMPVLRVLRVIQAST